MSAAGAAPGPAREAAVSGGGRAVLAAAVVLTVASSLTIQLAEGLAPRVAVGVLVTCALFAAGARVRRSARGVGDAVLALGALSVFGWFSALVTAMPAVAAWLADAPPAAAFLAVNATKLASVAALVAVIALCGWSRAGLSFVRGRLNAPTGIPFLTWGVAGPLVIVVVATLFLTGPEVLDRPRSLGETAPALLALLPLLVAGPLVNAVCEELLYRHALVSTMRPVTGAAVAVLTSSAVFGLGHLTGSPGGWTGVAFTFVYGLVSAIAMRQNRGAAWNLTMHFFADLAAVTALSLAVL